MTISILVVNINWTRRLCSIVYGTRRFVCASINSELRACRAMVRACRVKKTSNQSTGSTKFVSSNKNNNRFCPLTKYKSLGQK